MTYRSFLTNTGKAVFAGALYVVLGFTSPVADDSIQGAERRLYEYGIRHIEKAYQSGNLVVLRTVKSDGSKEIYVSFRSKDTPDVIDRDSYILNGPQITNDEIRLFKDCIRILESKRPNYLIPDYRYDIL